MFLRTTLRPTLAIVVGALALATGVAQGHPSGQFRDAAAASAIVVPMPDNAVLRSGPSFDHGGYVQLAQMDPRVGQLEEQIRQLTGTIEELNFQILQMQDQLRRMQEDYEQRFQDLEERRSDAGPAPSRDAAPRDTASAPAAPSNSSGDDEFYANVPRVEDGATVRGEPPRQLGSITFDAAGNPIGGEVSAPPAATTAPADNQTVAALPTGSTDDEIYRNSYQFVLSGDYDTAEAGFRDLIERFPNSTHAADAHFWLGESLLAQQKTREAAEIFLAANRNFPQARKAPDMLFKLGVSLAAMNQRDLACATFSEVLQRYPQTTDALRERLKQEQTTASC